MVVTRGLKDILSNFNVENNKSKQVKEFHFYFSSYLEVTLNKRNIVREEINVKHYTKLMLFRHSENLFK